MNFVQPIREKRQIEAMKRILFANNIRDYCLFTLGINSGLRISDLLNLRISDVVKLKIRDLVNRKIKIKDRITIKEKKTGKTKDFPICDVSKKAIIRYLNTRDYKLFEPLFLSRKGRKAITREHAWKIINDAAKMIGIEGNIGTHTLRKTFGYHAYQSGVGLSLIQKLLNHSAPSITLAYIGITQEELDDVYLNLNL